MPDITTEELKKACDEILAMNEEEFLALVEQANANPIVTQEFLDFIGFKL